MMYPKIGLTASLLLGSVCLITGAKVAGKDAKHEEPIKPDASAEDFKNVDCSKLSSAILNKLTDAKACTGLTARCVSEFDMTNVGAKCMNEIPLTEWKLFESKTVNQISRTSPKMLRLTVEQLAAIITKLDLGKLADGFAGYVVRTPVLLKVILDGGDGKIAAAFINAKTLPAMHINNFSRFSDSFIATLKEDAFTGISGTQLAIIPDTAFEGFYPKQWAKVAPKALNDLTYQQAKHLRIECWDATTVDQIGNFGHPVKKFNAMGLEEKDILNRRQFKEQHPCNAAEEMKNDMEEKNASKFEGRCKEVNDFNTNDSSMPTTSSITITLMLLIAALPSLI